jgi:hypothetical protein
MMDVSPSVITTLRWLRRSWWLLFPAFTVVTLRLGVERACADPHDLLPAVTSNPAWAWPIALVYVLTHAWTITAYVTTTVVAGTLWPSRVQWRSLWGRELYTVVAMAAALVLEYAPIALWRWLGTAGICGAGG